MVLEATIWRAEELGRNALDALCREDFVTAAILTRALMETTGSLLMIYDLLNRSIEKGIFEKLDETINRLLFGSKQWDEMEDPIHVNDMLRRVQSLIPGFFDDHYASLSEYAHPNWRGTFGAYGATHEGEARISFSHGGRDAEHQLDIILAHLSGALGIFLGYNDIAEQMIGDFVTVVEAHYAANGAPE
jgi:hypothetical protein